MTTLIWDHGESKPLTAEIHMKKAFGNPRGGREAYMICGNCSNQINQVYVCKNPECPGKQELVAGLTEILETMDDGNNTKDILQRTIQLMQNSGVAQPKSEWHMRKDKIRGIEFDERWKIAYLKKAIESKIVVSSEESVADLWFYLPIINTDHCYQIYNNDSKHGLHIIIPKIWQYLYSKKTYLLVEYGYGKKQRAGIIMATIDKLCNPVLGLYELRDVSLINEAKQIGMASIEDAKEFMDKMLGYTVDTENKRHGDFLDKVEEGTDFSKFEVEHEAVEANLGITFLDEGIKEVVAQV